MQQSAPKRIAILPDARLCATRGSASLIGSLDEHDSLHSRAM
jgi:hypothetical protein